MRVVVLNENGWGVKDIKDDYKVYKDIVGGYIECMYFPNEIICVVNEEGKLFNLPPVAGAMLNGALEDVIVGQCFFCSNVLTDDGYDFGDLDDEQLGWLENQLSYPKALLIRNNKVLPCLEWM